MKLRSTDQVAEEKQHMFNCAELLLEMFFSIKSTMWTIFCNLSHCFQQGDKLRLGCVHERKWDVQGEGKTEGGAQWYHGCGVGCQLWHAPMAFHGFSKSIYLCTCHNLSTVVRQADIFNTFHICNGICFKTYDNEMQKYCAIFHTHTALHTSLIRNNS